MTIFDDANNLARRIASGELTEENISLDELEKLKEIAAHIAIKIFEIVGDFAGAVVEYYVELLTKTDNA